jgi:hypothetical protein
MLLKVMAVLQDRLAEGSMMGCKPKMPSLSLCLLRPAGKQVRASTAHACLQAAVSACVVAIFLVS